MVSSNFKSSKISSSKSTGVKGHGLSNLGTNEPIDALCMQHKERASTSKNNTNDVTSFCNSPQNTKTILKKNMIEREVKIKLFILENERGFNNLTQREQMTEAVKKGTDEIQEWYFELGISDKLPNEWKIFKELLINYCSEKTIESLEKFS